MGKLQCAWASLCALIFASSAWAQSSVVVEYVHDYTPVSQWELSLAVGRGQMQSPLSDGGDIQLGVLPSIKYYGERFYLENTSLGFSLYESPRLAVDLAGRLNTDGLFFPGSGSNYLIQGMAAMGKLLDVNENPWGELEPPRRRLSYLGGFALRWLGPVNISLGAYRDVTGVHGGDEIPLAVGKQLRIGNFEAGLELGATYQSNALVDYYYGADMQSWEPAPLSIYRAGAALNQHVKLEGRFGVTDKISVVAAGRLEHLDDKIAQSPFVVRSEIHSFFVGLQYAL